MGVLRRAWSRLNSNICAITSLSEDMTAVSIMRDAMCGKHYRIVRGVLKVEGMVSEATMLMGWSECFERCQIVGCL